MPNIAEFDGPQSYPQAVLASFEVDMAVVRGVLTADQIDSLGPSAFSHRDQNASLLTGRRLAHMLPQMKEARHATVDWMDENIGRFAAHFPLFRYTQRADRIRNGAVERHVDNPFVVTATSMNLANGATPTRFCAERIASATARYSKIYAAWEQLDKNQPLASCTEIDAGDAVVMSRGAAHSVEAPADRHVLLVGTKRLFMF